MHYFLLYFILHKSKTNSWHYFENVISLINQKKDYLFTSERKHDDLKEKWKRND